MNKKAQEAGKEPRDDHQTHFTFGSDTERSPNSEQVELVQNTYRTRSNHRLKVRPGKHCTTII